MNEFKPFQAVLVRNSESQDWKPAVYTKFVNGFHYANHQPYFLVIPFNEETSHLEGTKLPYKKVENTYIIMCNGFDVTIPVAIVHDKTQVFDILKKNIKEDFEMGTDTWYTVLKQISSEKFEDCSDWFMENL